MKHARENHCKTGVAQFRVDLTQSGLDRTLFRAEVSAYGITCTDGKRLQSAFHRYKARRTPLLQNIERFVRNLHCACSQLARQVQL